MAGWLGVDTGRFATVPELARLGATPILCLRGEDEDDSACRHLHGAAVRSVTLPGGHYFGGRHERVADALLGGLTTAAASPGTR